MGQGVAMGMNREASEAPGEASRVCSAGGWTGVCSGPPSLPP